MLFKLTVNGASREVDVDPETPLLWVLRDELQLTGTKFGCGVAQCGACTVHVNGRTARSCVLPISWVGDKPVTTIEGLEGPVASAVQTAWQELNVPQCGFCQSGQIMSATALLQEIPKPDDGQIDGAMNGNVCRCATYQRVRDAVHKASAESGASSPSLRNKGEVSHG